MRCTCESKVEGTRAIPSSVCRSLLVLLLALMMACFTVIFSSQIAAAQSLSSKTTTVPNGCVPYRVNVAVDQSISYKAFELLNAERKSKGLEPFAWDAELERAALQRCAELSVYKDFASRPSGEPADTVVERDVEVFSAWEADTSFEGADLKSLIEEHASAPELAADYTAVGIGVAFDDEGEIPLVTVVFGKGGGTEPPKAAFAGIEQFVVPVPESCIEDAWLVSKDVSVGLTGTAELSKVGVLFGSGPDGKFDTIGIAYYEPQDLTWTIKRTARASIAAEGIVRGVSLGKTSAEPSFGDTRLLDKDNQSLSCEITVTKWIRLWGDDAFETMSRIVREAFPLEVCDVAVLATSQDYYDALTASGLAGLLRCPVLITHGDALDSEVAIELNRLGVNKVIIVGGENAVSDALKKPLVKTTGVRKIIRISGDNAAATALEVYRAGCARGGWGQTAFIATAGGYWDALAASPISYASHYPVFLAGSYQGDGSYALDSDAVREINAAGFKSIVVLGGASAVSDEVIEQLADSGAAISRLGGQTAGDTSAMIAAYDVQTCGASDAGAVVASSDGYWDALTGAALCGVRNTALILIDDDDTAAIKRFIEPIKNTFKTGYVLGGSTAVSKEAFDLLVSVTG